MGDGPGGSVMQPASKAAPMNGNDNFKDNDN